MANPRALYNRLQKQSESLTKRIVKTIELQCRLKDQVSQQRLIISGEKAGKVSLKQRRMVKAEIKSLQEKITEQVHLQAKLESKSAAMRTASSFLWERDGVDRDTVRRYLTVTKPELDTGYNDYMAREHSSSNRLFRGGHSRTYNLLRQVVNYYGPLMPSLDPPKVPEFQLDLDSMDVSAAAMVAVTVQSTNASAEESAVLRTGVNSLGDLSGLAAVTMNSASAEGLELLELARQQQQLVGLVADSVEQLAGVAAAVLKAVSEQPTGLLQHNRASSHTPPCYVGSDAAESEFKQIMELESHVP